MTDSLLLLRNAGLSALVCGLAAWWCRASARQELIRLKRTRRWIIRGEPQRALLLTVLVGLGCVVIALALGRGVWALWFLPPFPLVFRLFLNWARMGHLNLMEASCRPALQALHGFLSSGLSLSASLFLLADRQPMPFTLKLKKTLQWFDRGHSLGDCLNRFLRRTPSPLLGTVVSSLLAGYASGLPLLPFVEHGIQVLERHHRIQSRVARVRSLAVAQGAFAFCLPWGLLAYLAYSQGTSVRAYLSDGNFLSLSLLCLSWEVLGLWTLWRVAKFC